jgi:hypothetical protein
VHAVKIHKIPVYNILEFRYLSNQIIVKHFITTDLIVELETAVLYPLSLKMTYIATVLEVDVEAVKDGVAAVVEDDVRAVV